ncbi:MAG TPA: ABC transporter ATP-binding protein [Actinocrinis sp.]|nr:ABC transporter ATP-binding protein [Actinocrinis sp.]
MSASADNPAGVVPPARDTAGSRAGAAGPAAFPDAAPDRDLLLEARDVHRSFGQTPALRGADMAAARGEILAVMGPSGSGKSTLLHCLAGIFPPDRGEIWFDGRRLDTLGEAERTRLRRTDFGFVFQFGQLIPELTTADNIAMPLLLGRTRRRDAYRTAHEWLDRLDLAELGRRRTGELSGGQAQRVAIARALATKPKVLFADEPTGSLDSLTGELVMDLLLTVARQEGTTVVLVTHDARIAAYAERTVLVRDGRVTSPAVAGARR